MKRFIPSVFAIILLFSFVGNAKISLNDSPVHLDSEIAANEFGASSAYFCPLNDYIYYLKSSSSGTDVVVFDADASEYKTVKNFSPEADYISIAADQDGSIFLLRRDHDETSKSGIVCLKKENGEYFVLESLFPAASGEMIPVTFEFSPYSSMGAVRFWLNHEGEYLSFVSPVSMFWGSLMGLDELIYIVPGDLTAKVQKIDTLFDAYGYQTEDAKEFLKKFETGEALSPSHVSLSPNGNMLLMLVPFGEYDLIYVMDLYTYRLEILYLPDEFSGSVSWTMDGNITTIDDEGNELPVEWKGFEAGKWEYDEGFTDEGSLNDWS